MDLLRSDALAWIVAAIAFLALLARSLVFRRLLFTAAIATRAFARWIAGLVAGRRGHGPAEVRRAFEELGPTYIKLGQIIASSYGLFPERYCREFERCFDRVPPFPFE